AIAASSSSLVTSTDTPSSLAHNGARLIERPRQSWLHVNAGTIGEITEVWYLDDSAGASGAGGTSWASSALPPQDETKLKPTGHAEVLAHLDDLPSHRVHGGGLVNALRPTSQECPTADVHTGLWIIMAEPGYQQQSSCGCRCHTVTSKGFERSAAEVGEAQGLGAA